MTNEQREHAATKLRLDALSRDWNLHRDVEKQWRTFRDRTFLVAGILAILASVSVFTGAI